MEQHECAHTAKIDKLIEMMAENTVLTKQVSSCIFGNGQPGLKTRFERLEGGIAVWKWMAGGGGLIGIGAFILTLIKLIG